MKLIFLVVPLISMASLVSAEVAPHASSADQPGQNGPPTTPPRVRVEAPEYLKERLEKNGFAATPSWSDKLAPLYRSWKHSHFPVVVTTDAALHTSHLLFGWYQRFLEIAHLRGNLIDLTNALLAETMAQHDALKDTSLKAQALGNAAYLVVGKRLLTGGELSGVPEEWKPRIEGELKLISDAKESADSPLLGYKEDYTQYRPRGHYARNEEFASYFRALMWFGRMKFRFGEDSPAAGDHARRALLFCRALESSQVKGEKALDVWRRIYETTAFFAGRSDDLLPSDILGLLARRGKAVDPADEGDVAWFLGEVRKLRKPRILGTYAVSAVTAGGPEWRSATQGMTLFGQRYSLDGEIMQNLVFDRVLRFTGDPSDRTGRPFTLENANGVWIRAFPRGLDVMAVLGFDEARSLIREGGDDRYEKYGEQFEEMRKRIERVPAADWKEDLYVLRLRAAAELGRRPEGKLPEAMKAEAWRLKELAAALGSWTELKHDMILYTKQPYDVAQMAMAGLSKGGPVPPPPPPARGYVEPMPRVYAAIRDGVLALHTRIGTLGFPKDEALTGQLASFAEALRKLEDLSKKELAGQSLTGEEFEFIEDIGSVFSIPKYGFPHHRDVESSFMTEMDDVMAIVADVYTEVNTNQALEEAVGRPLILYMVCPVNGEPTTCLGVAYSYYEFKQPTSQRLTDEEWRKLLQKRKAPGPVSWMRGYVVEAR